MIPVSFRAICHSNKLHFNFPASTKSPTSSFLGLTPMWHTQKLYKLSLSLWQNRYSSPVLIPRNNQIGMYHTPQAAKKNNKTRTYHKQRKLLLLVWKYCTLVLHMISEYLEILETIHKICCFPGLKEVVCISSAILTMNLCNLSPQTPHSISLLKYQLYFRVPTHPPPTPPLLPLS